MCMVGALGFLAVILKTGRRTDAVCVAETAVGELFFATFFGALLCKMLRICKIFFNKQLKRLRNTKRDSQRLFAALVVVECAFLSLWQGVAPTRAVSQQVKQLTG